VDQLKVYVSAIFENLARKLFANIASLPSNFQTAALKERLSMPAVAIAVSSVSSLLFSLSCRLEEGRESLQTRDTRGKTEDLQLHCRRLSADAGERDVRARIARIARLVNRGIQSCSSLSLADLRKDGSLLARDRQRKTDDLPLDSRRFAVDGGVQERRVKTAKIGEPRDPELLFSGLQA
jgi:hypothetical protein